MGNETASQMSRRLMGEVEKDAKHTYTKGEVKAILNSISQAANDPAPERDDEAIGCRAPASVSDLRRGDVFIAKAVGGKVRPWIVLHIENDVVSAIAVSSSDSAPLMVKSECRLWPGGWIGKTISVFSLETATKEVTRPYTNMQHLDEMQASILSTYGPKKVVSISDIRSKMMGGRNG